MHTNTNYILYLQHIYPSSGSFTYSAHIFSHNKNAMEHIDRTTTSFEDDKNLFDCDKENIDPYHSVNQRERNSRSSNGNERNNMPVKGRKPLQEIYIGTIPYAIIPDDAIQNNSNITILSDGITVKVQNVKGKMSASSSKNKKKKVSKKIKKKTNNNTSYSSNVRGFR